VIAHLSFPVLGYGVHVRVQFLALNRAVQYISFELNLLLHFHYWVVLSSFTLNYNFLLENKYANWNRFEANCAIADFFISG
jgi:hypothetical protein